MSGQAAARSPCRRCHPAAATERRAGLLHGRHDRFVTFAHGQWLAAHVPGAEARLSDGDGYLTLMENRTGEVHAWLSSRR